MKQARPYIKPEKRLKGKKIPPDIKNEAVAIAKELDAGVHFAELNGRRMYQTGVVSFVLKRWYRLVAVPTETGYCAVEIMSHEAYNKSGYVKA